MDNTLAANIYIFILACVFAILEIQIEGEHGWARNLPTWRPKKKNWAVNLYETIMSGKELTGYHLTIFALVFLLFQLPYFFGYSLSWEHLAKTFSLYLLFVPLWDFLWFVFNPHYPLHKFKGEHIWWHETWLFGLPVDYFWGVTISLVIVLLGMIFGNADSLFHWWITNMLLFIVETCLAILFTLNVLNIDNWNRKDSPFHSFRGR